MAESSAAALMRVFTCDRKALARCDVKFCDFSQSLPPALFLDTGWRPWWPSLLTVWVEHGPAILGDPPAGAHPDAWARLQDLHLQFKDATG